MLKIKDFTEKKITFIDEDNEEYVLTAEGNQKFDRDIIEDILDWGYRFGHRKEKK